jgi:AcrR family transcriptional regulator
VFLAQGYGASMDAIAAEAGVSKQTVYSHFKDKQSLFNAIADRLLDRFVLAGLTPEIMALSPPLFFRKIASIAVAQMDDWEYTSFIRLIVAQSNRFPELADVYIERLVRPATHHLTEFITAHKELRFNDPEAVARIIHGSLLYFITVQQLLGGKHTMPMSRERLIDSLVDMVVFAGQAGKDKS